MPVAPPAPQKWWHLPAKLTKHVGRQYIALIAIAISTASPATQCSGNANQAQAQANNAQIRTEDAAAYAALSRDARQVSYWVLGSQMMIQNSSGGLIRDITLFLPKPTKPGTAAAQLALPKGFPGAQFGVQLVGRTPYLYYAVPEIPPCRIESTTAYASVFKAPKVGAFG